MAYQRNNNNRRRTPRPRRNERQACPGPRRHANVTVVTRRDEPAEKVIKRFVRLCKKERIVEQVRENRYFTKPSDVRRLKRAASIREADRLEKKAEKKKAAHLKKQNKARRMRAKGGGTDGSTR